MNPKDINFYSKSDTKAVKVATFKLKVAALIKKGHTKQYARKLAKGMK